MKRKITLWNLSILNLEYVGTLPKCCINENIVIKTGYSFERDFAEPQEY